MGDALDQFSKSLASGASRRHALGALLAGSALALPFTVEGKKNKKKKKLQQKFAPYQGVCEDWCRINSQLSNSGVNFGLCVKDAKTGKGDCFSSSKGGVGALCVGKCDATTCCPTILGSGDVDRVECCSSESCSSAVNGTMFCV